MLPKYCTIKDNNNLCNEPPAYIVSLLTNDGEYLLCLICIKHKPIVEEIFKDIKGIKFEELRYIGTNCLSRVLNGIVSHTHS